MRVFLGIILGVLLTVSGAYVVDSIATGPQIVAPSAEQRNDAPRERTMVNWDVVGRKWESLKTRVHSEWIRLSEVKT
jgi:hypothetical protein